MWRRSGLRWSRTPVVRSPTQDLVKEERVDAVVPGDALGLDLAEELGRLRPFGMGNPGVSVLVPAARVSDVQPMSEGRHVRFTVTSGGVRSRAVGFGIGAATAPVLRDAQARHDLTARLEANEWRGAVEPRLVIRSLHSLAHDGPPAAAEDDAGWWDAVWAAYEAPSPGLRCARRAPNVRLSIAAAREPWACSATS